jgi:hypothetical protein
VIVDLAIQRVDLPGSDVIANTNHHLPGELGCATTDVSVERKCPGALAGEFPIALKPDDCVNLIAAEFAISDADLGRVRTDVTSDVPIESLLKV